DELGRRALDLSGKIAALVFHLESLGLKETKEKLLTSSHEVTFWDDPLRARSVLAEVAALEKALDAPSRLKKRFKDLEEQLARAERVRECVLRIEGVCAFGLLRGEEGLHHWIDRRGLARTDTKSRDVSFVRAQVLAPASVELREDEVKVELRPLKRAQGKLMK